MSPLIANLPATIDPTVTYTGSNQLSFALTEAPAGMAIDFSDGIITWTPQDSDEGQSFDVTVKVNDGAIFSETSFQVTVIQPEPLATEIQENVLTVNDQNTNLDGLSITTLPADTPTPPANLPTLEELQETLEKAAPESVSEIPSWITRTSDVFVVKSSFNNRVELRFTIGQLPDGVPLNDVNFYVYTSGLHEVENSWAPVAIERSFEGTEENPVYVLSLGALQGLGFFGYHSTSPATPFEPNPSDNNQRAPRSEPDSSSNEPRVRRVHASGTAKPPISSSIFVDASLIECVAAVDEAGEEDHNNMTCTYAPDPEVEIKVENFGVPVGNQEPTRWRGVTVNALAMWVIKAQLGVALLEGMKYDKKITVRIERMAVPWEGTCHREL